MIITKFSFQKKRHARLTAASKVAPAAPQHPINLLLSSPRGLLGASFSQQPSTQKPPGSLPVPPSQQQPPNIEPDLT